MLANYQEMEVFVTIAMFLCISYLVHSELKNVEDEMCTEFCLLIAWALCRYILPIPLLDMGFLSISFWDLSLGMLTIMVFYCLLQKMFGGMHISPWKRLTKMFCCIWTYSINACKTIRGIAIEILQDKLLFYTMLSLLLLYVAIMLKTYKIWIYR